MRKASLIRHSLNSKAEKRIKKSEKPGSKMKWRRLSIKKIRQWLAINNGLNSGNDVFYLWNFWKTDSFQEEIFLIA